MWIKDKADIKRFKELIDKCSSSVWLVDYSGQEYDLKDPFGYYLGLSCLLKAEGYDEPEIFAQSREDQVLLFNYLTGRQLPQAS